MGPGPRTPGKEIIRPSRRQENVHGFIKPARSSFRQGKGSPSQPIDPHRLPPSAEACFISGKPLSTLPWNTRNPQKNAIKRSSSEKKGCQPVILPIYFPCFPIYTIYLTGRCQSGRMSTPGKCVYRKPVPRVRIPPCPPLIFTVICCMSIYYGFCLEGYGEEKGKI